jgi:hypothetical protein
VSITVISSLTKLANSLSKLGYLRETEDIMEILNEFLKEDKESDGVDLAGIANSTGLQENEIHEYYGGNFSPEIIFFDKGDLTAR